MIRALLLTAMAAVIAGCGAQSGLYWGPDGVGFKGVNGSVAVQQIPTADPLETHVRVHAVRADGQFPTVATSVVTQNNEAFIDLKIRPREFVATRTITVEK